MADPADERMAELESRLAFQEDLIENLNLVVTRQDREIIALKQHLTDLVGQIREIHDSAATAGTGAGIEIPPHY